MTTRRWCRQSCEKTLAVILTHLSKALGENLDGIRKGNKESGVWGLDRICQLGQHVRELPNNADKLLLSIVIKSALLFSAHGASATLQSHGTGETSNLNSSILAVCGPRPQPSYTGNQERLPPALFSPRSSVDWGQSRGSHTESLGYNSTWIM